MLNDIQKLRDLTGAGVVDCKNALIETQGDLDKAITIIRERGLVKAEKRSARQTGAGLIETYVHNERIGVMLELRCETDFVARSTPFKELSHQLVMQIAAMDPQNIEQLSSQLYIKDESRTISDIIKQVIAQTGENITVARFCRYEV